jgi:hypothetical protein
MVSQPNGQVDCLDFGLWMVPKRGDSLKWDTLLKTGTTYHVSTHPLELPTRKKYSNP